MLMTYTLITNELLVQNLIFTDKNTPNNILLRNIKLKIQILNLIFKSKNTIFFQKYCFETT